MGGSDAERKSGEKDAAWSVVLKKRSGGVCGEIEIIDKK